MKTKFRAIIACLSLAVCTMFAGVWTSLTASADVEQTPVSVSDIVVSMEKGAEIKDGDSVSEMGLRFGMYMSKSDYTALKESTLYDSVSFGILIAPKNYHTAKPLNNVSNVFGENAVYDWPDANGVYNGTNSYDPETQKGKLRIGNMESNIMVEAAEDSNKMRYLGSLIDIQTQNLTREFVGVGYIKYHLTTEAEGEYGYIFATENDNVRSAAYQAQLTVDSGKDTEGKVQDNFLDRVPENQRYASYQVKHYLKVNEEYQLKDTQNCENTAWGTQVTATAKEYVGYVFNSEQSIATGKIYANNRLTLHMYYDPITMVNEIIRTASLQDIDGASTFDLKDLLSEQEQADVANYEAWSPLQWTVQPLRAASSGEGNSYVPVGTAVNVQDGMMDFETLSYGNYRVCATVELGDGEQKVFTGDVDFYNSTQAPVWNTVNDSITDVWWRSQGNTDINSNAETVSITSKTNTNNETFDCFAIKPTGSSTYLDQYISIVPIHSKAYYQLPQYTAYGLYMEAYYEKSFWGGIGFGTNNNSTSGWYSGVISFADLVNNWELIAGNFAKAKENDTVDKGMLKITNTDNIVYVGNLKSVLNVSTITHTDSLADVKDSLQNNKYDLTNLITDETEKVTFDGYAAMGEVTWSLTNKYSKAYEVSGTWDTVWETNANSRTYTATGSVVDFANVPYTVYDVKATLSLNGTTYDLFIGQVDFYNSAEAPVWNYISEETVDYAWGWTGSNSTQGLNKAVISAVELTEEGHTGNYFKMATDEIVSGGRPMHYNIMALHTEAYYELYNDYTLTFEYKILNTNATMHYYDGFTKVESQTTATTWCTAKISVGALLNNWKVICGSYTDTSMIYCSGILTDTRCLYVGNFKLVKE